LKILISLDYRFNFSLSIYFKEDDFLDGLFNLKKEGESTIVSMFCFLADPEDRI